MSCDHEVANEWARCSGKNASKITFVDVAWCCSRLARFVQQYCTPEHAHQFDFQYPTCRNRVAKRVQHVAPNNVAICCADMLRSFGRSLQMLGQQCCDMLCWYAAIVWPGLDPLVNITFFFTPKKAALPARLKLVYLLALASREKKFSFKVHLTPKFFFAKTNLLVIWNSSAKKNLDSVTSSIFCAPTKSRK